MEWGLEPKPKSCQRFEKESQDNIGASEVCARAWACTGRLRCNGYVANFIIHSSISRHVGDFYTQTRRINSRRLAHPIKKKTNPDENPTMISIHLTSRHRPLHPECLLPPETHCRVHSPTPYPSPPAASPHSHSQCSAPLYHRSVGTA